MSDRLLLVEKKCDFSGKFKLKLITTCHLWFIVKVLWKYYEYITSLFHMSDMFHQSPKKNIYIYIYISYLLGGLVIFIANHIY